MLVVFIYLNIAFFITAFIPVITQSNVIADTFMTISITKAGITERRTAFSINMLKVTAYTVVLANLLIQLNNYAGILLAFLNLYSPLRSLVAETIRLKPLSVLPLAEIAYCSAFQLPPAALTVT